MLHVVHCRWRPAILVVALICAHPRADFPANAVQAQDPASPSAAPGEATDAAATPTAAAPTTAAPVADAAAAPPAPAPVVSPPPPLPLDLQPYRVLVGLGVQSNSKFPSSFADTMTLALRRALDSRVGRLWNADVTPLPWLDPGVRGVLDDLTSESLNERFLPTDYDKVFLATVEADGAGYRLSAREWDRNSQSATAVSSRLEFESRVVGDRLFAELLAHFRPIAEIEGVSEDGKTVEMRLRGGELLMPDPAAAPVQVGMYLAPYYRYYDRQKELRKLQPLDWSYLQVTDVNRGLLTGQLTSAFPNPLAGSRRRVDLMAIAVTPRYPDTELTLYPRGQADNPLAGVRVDVLDREPTDDDKVTDRLVLYTGRDGTLRVPAAPAQPLQYIYVMSGKTVLATVPFISGNVPTARLEVPDDGPRLSVEGEVAIMEAELIELVARREVTIARALGHAKARQWAEADILVEEVKNLPTSEQLLDRLERIRLPAVDASRQTKNRVGESRINKLCRTMKEAIERHLNPDRLRTFLQEYRELKEIG